MDGGGRVAGPVRERPVTDRQPPLMPRPKSAAKRAAKPAPQPPAGRHKSRPPEPRGPEPRPASRAALLMRRLTVRLSGSRLGRRGTSLLTALVIGGFTAYGIVLGGHVESAKEVGIDLADAVANVAGFKVTQVDLSGHNHVTPGQILAAAGIKGSTSILFVNADEARARLEALPWIRSASVRKFFPDRIEISVAERDGFALWQINGEISVIARDGTVIAPYSDDPRYVRLPIVVGEGADRNVGEIVDALARLPAVADQVRAAIRVADRRWTLKMRNGIDVRLPEERVEAALMELAALDQDKKLLTRDITIVDLRLPDRVVVRLSDTAADARAAMLKARKAKKGGPA